MKKCKRISINGVAYFGEIIDVEGGKKIQNAVQEGISMSETVRTWVKTRNLSNLQTLEISGDATYVVQSLTEDQMDEAELIIISAARATTNALPELINSKF